MRISYFLINSFLNEEIRLVAFFWVLGGAEPRSSRNPGFFFDMVKVRKLTPILENCQFFQLLYKQPKKWCFNFDH